MDAKQTKLEYRGCLIVSEPRHYSGFGSKFIVSCRGKRIATANTLEDAKQLADLHDLIG
jgi:hypothetical protein